MTEILTKLDSAKQTGALSEAAVMNIRAWLMNDQLADFHQQIVKLIDQSDWQTLSDDFYTQLEFGTAGIRGRTGLGSARINRWTVGTATQGLADYIQLAGNPTKGVVIGSDTRLTSPEFVELVINILSSNDIKVYRFKNPPQVGMFSFAVRHFKAQAGIYISASHNPPTDNGLKIYWEDGAQLLPPHDKALIEAVKKVAKFNQTTRQPDNQTTIIGESFDETYRHRVLQESVYDGRSAKIVYSPFHGTGIYGVLPIMREAGFEVITVDEQMTPDGNFPNIPGGIPNPQNRESNTLTAQKVLETGADVGISTDPDADRLALVVPKGDTTFILDGNETATLLAYFICKQLKEGHKLPTNGFLVRTFVSTPMIDAIADDFGLKYYSDLPVGFKFIGECIKQHEDVGNELFIFAGEESFGCLKGSYARDKDASSAVLIAAEMISWLKDTGKTVWDLLDEVYNKYGYYLLDLVDIKIEGASGFDTMTKLMNGLRSAPPQTIGSWNVKRVIDRSCNEVKDNSSEVIEKLVGHTTNAIILELSDDHNNWVVVRPSGTEPKVKLYTCVYQPVTGSKSIASVRETALQTSQQLKTAITTLVERSTS